MKKWISKNLDLLFIFSVTIVAGFVIVMSAQKPTPENVELQENYEELYSELDDLFGEVGEKFEFIEKDVDELKKQQEHYVVLLEDYYKLVAEKTILEDKLAQAKEDAKGIYT